MKRIYVLLLAAAMILSTAGCSEKEGSGTPPRDIVSNMPKNDSSIVEDSSSTAEPDSVANSEISSTGESSIASDSETDSSDDDILTPPITEAQEIAKAEHSDYSFFVKATDYSDLEAPKYYEGEIVDDAVKQMIFEKICPILERNELSLEDEPSVIVDDLMLTLKNADGDEYCISEGFIGYDFVRDQGTPVYYLTAPNSKCCFEISMEEMNDIRNLLEDAVMTEENLIGTGDGNNVGTNLPEDAEKPEFPITYISLRTNYAWGTQICGSFLDSRGYMYTFDLSKDMDYNVDNTSFEELLYNNLMNGNGNIKTNGVGADIECINEGLEYAAQIGPDVKFDQKHMMCDFGQNTLYAIVDGKFVMLESFGDSDKTSNDENVQSAISAYNKAISKMSKPV